MTQKVRRWGYSADDAQIFELAPGESLPAGYFDSPAKVTAASSEPAPEPISDALAAQRTHEAERRALLDRARELGVETRGTQSNERLRQRIEAAEAAEAEAPAADVIGETESA